MREIKRVALIGLGAIGGFASREIYQLLGDEFYVIASGERKKRLEENGVIINDICYKYRVEEPDHCEAYPDLVIFTVKNTHLEQAIKDAKCHIGPDTIVMSLLNGVSSEERIRAAYDNGHVLTAMVRVPSLNQNGRISYPENWGTIYFGNETNDPDHLSEDVTAVKNLLETAGLKYQIPNDMVRELWIKFMMNVSENQPTAIIGVPYKAFNASREHFDMLRVLAGREVVAVAQAKGIHLTLDDLEAVKSYIYVLRPDGKTSTLQDLEAGRKTEVEYFAGDMIRMGKETGVQTPVNEIFYHMIYALEEKNEGKFNI